MRSDAVNMAAGQIWSTGDYGFVWSRVPHSAAYVYILGMFLADVNVSRDGYYWGGCPLRSLQW